MGIQISTQSICRLFTKAKPFLAVVFLQLGFAGLSIMAKLALNQGMSHYSFVVYRHAIATAVIAPFAIILERRVRPRMTFPIITKILLLGLLEPVLDQNLYYAGMKYTSVTFASAMCNILPALTFVLACIARLETVNFRNLHGQAKVLGTVVTIGGAMLISFVKGPIIEIPWTKGRHQRLTAGVDHQDSVMGLVMIIVSCICWAGFIILQAITLRTYPAELSLTAWICAVGTVEGAAVAFATNWGNNAIWSLHWDRKFQVALYSGIVCSGIAYYVQGVIMRERGAVFITAFSPLSLILVAFLGTFILAEQVHLGSLMGASVIVAGLYLVVWGKSRDNMSSSPSNNELQIIPIESPSLSPSPPQLMAAISDGRENPAPAIHVANNRVRPYPTEGPLFTANGVV